LEVFIEHVHSFEGYVLYATITLAGPFYSSLHLTT